MNNKIKNTTILIFAIILLSSIAIAYTPGVSVKETAANQMGLYTIGAERIRITDGGFVGIATVSPTNTLQINGTTNTTYLVISNNTASNCDLKADTRGNVYCGTDADTNTPDGNGGWQNTTTYTTTNLDVNITNATGATILFINRTTKNLGIGTSDPNSTLDVTGNQYLRGSLTVNNPAGTNLNPFLYVTGDADGAFQSVTYAIHFQPNITIVEESSAVGFQVEPIVTRGSGVTATSFTGMQVNASTDTGTSTVTSATALSIAPPDYGTSRTGLYVGSVSGGTANYAAIFEAGSVGIGTTTPGTILDVIGNVSFNQSLYVQNNGRVSIGRVNGSRNLDIHGSTDSYIHLTNSDTGQTDNDGSLIGVGSSEDLVLLNREATNVRIFANNLEYIRLNGTTGYLGVSTTAPAAMLDVRGNVSFNQTLYVQNNGRVGIGTATPDGTFTIASAGPKIIIEKWVDNNVFSGIAFGYNNVSQYGYALLGNSVSTFINAPGVGSTGNIYFAIANTNYMILNSSGYLGIGTTLPQVLTHIQSGADTDVLRLQDSDGTCNFNPESGSITPSCSSDERLKANITDAPDALPEITGLPIKAYTVKSSGDKMIGVIAQEMLENYPEYVHVDTDGYYMVDEVNPWKLVKAIQELEDENELLRVQIEALTSRLESVENTVSNAK